MICLSNIFGFVYCCLGKNCFAITQHVKLCIVFRQKCYYKYSCHGSQSQRLSYLPPLDLYWRFPLTLPSLSLSSTLKCCSTSVRERQTSCQGFLWTIRCTFSARSSTPDFSLASLCFCLSLRCVCVCVCRKPEGGTEEWDDYHLGRLDPCLSHLAALSPLSS